MAIAHRYLVAIFGLLFLSHHVLTMPVSYVWSNEAHATHTTPAELLRDTLTAPADLCSFVRTHTILPDSTHGLFVVLSYDQMPLTSYRFLQWTRQFAATTTTTASTPFAALLDSVTHSARAARLNILDDTLPAAHVADSLSECLRGNDATRSIRSISLSISSPSDLVKIQSFVEAGVHQPTVLSITIGAGMDSCLRSSNVESCAREWNSIVDPMLTSVLDALKSVSYSALWYTGSANIDDDLNSNGNVSGSRRLFTDDEPIIIAPKSTATPTTVYMNTPLLTGMLLMLIFGLLFYVSMAMLFSLRTPDQFEGDDVPGAKKFQ